MSTASEAIVQDVSRLHPAGGKRSSKRERILAALPEGALLIQLGGPGMLIGMGGGSASSMTKIAGRMRKVPLAES